MNTSERLYTEKKNFNYFAKGYLRILSDLLEGLDVSQIKAFADVLERARVEERTIFVIGNGGSAATASHMANDFGIDVRKHAGNQQMFRLISLTDCVPVMTAIANDDSYENIFLTQLKVLYRPLDILICISASGNSPNIIKAAQWAKGNGGVILSMTGFDGGKLKEMSDAVIHVATPKGDFGHVEDVHMIMNHLLVNWFVQFLKAK